MELIRESGWKEFPPRLEIQPIFYPVCNQQYAEEIASRWNTVDAAFGYAGFVNRLELDLAFFPGCKANESKNKELRDF